MPLTVIEGLLTFWEETKKHKHPHMMVTQKGNFKWKHNLRWHCVPLADQTKSNIPTWRWVSRLLHRRSVMEGKRNGHLSARQNGSKASLGDYDPMCRAKYPKRFLEAVAINDYSLRRSLRRDATTESQNNQVDLVVAIELNNRWRKKEAVKGVESTRFTLRQVLTQVSRAVVAALQFYQIH